MKFTQLDPAQVRVGRGLAAHLAREPYRIALQVGAAGKIELEGNEVASTCRRLLAAAARDEGKRIRASYVPKENAIYWKTLGAPVAASASGAE